jgi:hypothetical protein
MDSITTFAKRNNISRQRVQQLINTGKIIAKKNGNSWVILGDQVRPPVITKRIEQRGVEGDIIATFKTVDEAGEAVGCSAKNIYRVLNDPRAKAKGFYFTQKK